MELVDDNKRQRVKDPVEAGGLIDEQGFERFGRDQQHSAGTIEKPTFLFGGDVAVPPMDGNLRIFAQLFESAELIVDQGLERPDVQCANRTERAVTDARQDWQESSLCFSGGGPGGQHDVVFR